MILLCFSYFPEGENVDYNSGNEDHDDEDEILWLCCDGCNLRYHSPCVLRKLPQNIPSKNGFAANKSFLTNFQEFCFYTNTNI